MIFILCPVERSNCIKSKKHEYLCSPFAVPRSFLSKLPIYAAYMELIIARIFYLYIYTLLQPWMTRSSIYITTG